MIIPLLAKLYGIILKNKINIWLEGQGKITKEKGSFGRYYSSIDYLINLRIILEECCNNKLNLLCCFVDFRKSFDTILMNNLWKILEELKVHFKLIATAIRLYQNAIAHFKNTSGWSEDINCDIEVKQGCPFSPTIFGIYIHKLEG